MGDRRYVRLVPQDLIHARTRTAFREYLSGNAVLREISRLFDDEGIECSPLEPNVGGARRSLVEQYYATVDWTNQSDVSRVIRVYESVLAGASQEERDRLAAYLRRDGLVANGDGRILSSVSAGLAAMPAHLLSDASSIYEHIDRISRCAESDPAQAISGAKALIEATTKLVLKELNEPYDEKADVAALVKQVQMALKLHPETLAPTTKGVETVKRILSNLSQVAIGVAELRNAYGPDHGRTTSVRLRPRHAHLAVGCAATYCRMVLETLEARQRAP